MKIPSLLSSVCLSAALLGATALAAPKPEDEARKSAESWLALIDAGKLAESWTASAESFRVSMTEPQWVQSLRAVRTPLGDLVSRKVKSATHTKTLPGAPDGDYVVLQFDTSFTNKKQAIETVTPVLEKNGQWRVSGYYIK